MAADPADRAAGTVDPASAPFTPVPLTPEQLRLWKRLYDLLAEPEPEPSNGPQDAESVSCTLRELRVPWWLEELRRGSG